MSKVFVINKKQIRLVAIVALVVIAAAVYLRWNQTNAAQTMAGSPHVFTMVTGEFKTTNENGQKLELYTWHPGTIVVPRGEPVQLNIIGFNGDSHPFVIEGLNIKGTVKKGETTTVNFTADHPGTYPILCLTHQEPKQKGPMVGYLIVQ
ncbi:hypothetical protein EBB07_02880 [Paenibacillaceae bacterium]|nr:hypothetical protein EBB07_02880 [Paenibacillaceae bacterium]